MIALKITEYQAYASNISANKFSVMFEVGSKHVAKGDKKSTFGGLLYTETIKFTDGRLKVRVWRNPPSHKRKAKKTLVDEFFVDEPTGEVLRVMLNRAYEAKGGEEE